MQKKLSVWIQSLGCPKNAVDTEQFLGSLGYGIKSARKIGTAQLVFINTCAFIESACQESLRAIFDAAAEIKKLKRKPLFAVAGCLPGRYGIETLAKEIPEVDLWLDSKSVDDWPQKLNNALAIKTQPIKGRLIGKSAYAWLKISEGCLRHCAFCTIPSIRGPLKSVPAHQILKEAGDLLGAGAKELILVGQDVGAWGRDMIMNGTRGKDPVYIVQGQPVQNLAGLLALMRALKGLQWLRLMYLHPASISDDLLEIIAEGLPVLPYLDVPFQHCQKNLLTAMGRPTGKSPYAVIENIRSFLPGAALRTTLMVGFPGETEKDFKELCRFVENVRFQNLGVFKFMPEEGTKAANLRGQVPEDVKEERAAEIMRIQSEISREILEQYLGMEMAVLVDRPCEEEWPGLYEGRVWFQAPEVDGLTYISGSGVKKGKMVDAEIVDTQTYDLSALK